MGTPDTHDPDRDRGLYGKFTVERNHPHRKQVEGDCEYFVLDIAHDPHALLALRVYAESCRDDFPLLYSDLIDLIDKQGQEAP